jgi:hypothetical protein
VLWGVSWFPTWPSCRGTQKAGGCHQCVVRVREQGAPNAGSARALLMRFSIFATRVGPQQELAENFVPLMNHFFPAD